MTLQLSPDYISIEDRSAVKPKPVIIKRTNNLPKGRLIRLLGKGDIVKGSEEYLKYYDRIIEEGTDILWLLKATRRMKPYAEYLGYDGSTLSATLMRKRSNSTDFRTLKTFHKVVKNYDRFLEEMR